MTSFRSLKYTELILLAMALVLGPLTFLWLQPAEGFQNPSASRCVVLHVPMAELACVAFVVSAVYAVFYLRTRRLQDDDASAAAAEIGLLSCFLATVSGSIFARTQWGSWWNWDPKETSVFFLLLIYGAYFALRGNVEDPTRRALFASVYALLACLVMPFLVYVLPRVIFSLHPSTPHMDHSYWTVMLTATIAFAAFLTWLFRMRCALGRARLAVESAETDDSAALRPTMQYRSNGGAERGEVRREK